MFRYIILIIFLLNTNKSFSQDITGTWEGDLNNYEFLQVNIVQVGNTICGYTWDYLYNNRRDYCMANFTGTYDSKRKQWILTGYSFIENSGSHVLMNILLSYSTFEGKQILDGWESQLFKGKMLSTFSRLSQPNILLKKVSDSPSQLLDNMKDCSQAKQSGEDSITVITPYNPSPERIPLPALDTSFTIRPPVMTPAVKDSIGLSAKMGSRKNTEVKHIVVHEKNITLDVYDNAIVDGDTISIFYNGKLVLSHQPLQEKAIVIPLKLDEKTTRHEITLFAENLGSIPPNTALIVVHAGDKRYELFASASLTENAVIVFDYKPK